MLRSNKTTSLFLQTTVIASLSFIFTFAGSDPSLATNLGFAQNLGFNPIQILSTSSLVDDLGNFHVIGEVNNTSFDPQTNILVTTILSNTANNTIVGNHSAFSSIGTLRHGESSPFDILIQDPQILGKFNFMEFSTSSQPAMEKPANLVLNGSSAFFDNVGNPHITGNIINQGQFPEQFINLVATFYDNSSLGIVGTQSFGLDVANLSQNQMAPFDITIFDNKTKSQGAFYSLNVESDKSSMSLPFSSKSSFVSTGGSFSGLDVLSDNSSSSSSSSSSMGLPSIDNSNNDSSNPRNDSDNDDNQRGEKKTDDDGNPYYNDENCSEEPGSSGGDSSECQDAENEEQSERDDEDSSERDQGPPSNSDSTGDNNGEDIDSGNGSDGGESNGDENTDGSEENGSSDDNDNN